MSGDNPDASPVAAPPPPDKTGLLRSMRIPLAILWVVSAGAFFVPESATASALQLVFVGLVVIHAVECVVFLPALRASGRPLAGQLVQVMLFGVIHYGLLQVEQAQASSGTGNG